MISRSNRQPGPTLVTGAAGFIGSVVCQKLLASSNPVVGVDNVNDYYDRRLKRYRIEKLRSDDRFEFLEVNICDRDVIGRLFEQYEFESVINLAAYVGVRHSFDKPEMYVTTNVDGNLNLLEQMKLHGVSKYVLASTSSLYSGHELPFVESQPVNSPISPYAASKKAAELMAHTYHHLFDIDVTVVRYFTVFGPAGRPDMGYFKFISLIDRGEPIQIFGDGSQARDFCFVDDIARGTIAAARQGLGYEIVNLGGGRQPCNIKTLVHKIETLLGKKARIQFCDFHRADMRSTFANIEKAARLLNWVPEISLDTGLERCVKWYVDNRPWTSEIVLN